MNEEEEREAYRRLKRELDFQKVEIETLRAELLLSKLENAAQNDEKQHRVDELILAKKELATQNTEKRKRAEELIIANEELDFQKDEKQKRAFELLSANNQLALQYHQKQKRTQELLSTKEDLALYKNKRQKWMDELLTANKELALQQHQRQQQDDELVILHKELALQYEEKKALASELTYAYTDLIKTEEALRKHIEGLENMIFMISHKVRQPIAQILGISYLLEETVDYSSEELKKIVGYLKPSALDLDQFTTEFTAFMNTIYSKEGGTIPAQHIQ